jgi:hypothetical protein
MIIPFGIGVFLLFLAAGFAVFAWLTEYRLVTEEQRPESNRWLIRGLRIDNGSVPRRLARRKAKPGGRGAAGPNNLFGFQVGVHISMTC